MHRSLNTLISRGMANSIFTYAFRWVSIFERFRTALQWVAEEKLGIKFMTHVLYNYLIVGKSATWCHKKT